MQQHSHFEAYNHTELYQTCMQAGILVRPNEGREEMIAYLEGWKEPPVLSDADHVFHTWRHGIINFINEYWSKLETQLMCPARLMKHPTTPNPKPCFGCLDAQVVHCLVSNPENASLIEAHRLVRRPRTT